MKMPRLIAPFARVTIVLEPQEPNLVFQSGDDLLQSCYVELSETDRSSNCGFTVNDPGMKLAAKFFDISFLRGGIQVPVDLLQPNPAIEQERESFRPVTRSTAVLKSEPPEIVAWLDTISFAEGTDGPDGYRTLYGGGLFQGYRDHPRIKIDGSTAAGRYQFLSEDPNTWDEVKNKLGLPDFSPNSQDAAAVQKIKERGAYQSALQGVAGLDATLEKLSWEWASLPPFRYKGQGQYSRDKILEVYKQNLARLKSGASSGTQTPSAQQNSNAPIASLMDNETKKLIENASKGTEIIVEMGYPGSLTEFHYVHVGTEASGRSPDTTTFQGQCVRWLMTRRKKNTAYTNITLRQLAQKVAAAYGLKLDMEGDGPTYSFLSQDGISDYQLLLRESRAIGYGLTDTKNVLILKPLRPNFTGFVITRDMLLDKGALRFTDRASADRIPLSALTPNQPSATATDPKTAKDRGTGQPNQVKPEDASAAGKTGAMVTGGTVAPMTGTPAVESAKNTPINEQTPTIADPISTVKAGQILPSSVTALPNQQIGAIALGTDGRAEAQRLVAEQKRVKGYESTARLIMSPESVTLAPGSIIAISEEVVPYPFAREWRVSTARHSIQGGKATTELHFYSPQAAKTDNLDGVQTTPVDNSGQATAPPGKLQNPMPGTDRGTPFDPSGSIRGRPHKGIDLAGDRDDYPILAAESGTIFDSGYRDDGYGNAVLIRHEGLWEGYVTLYGHLSKINVSNGQKVAKGQVIGVEGSTGFSTGPHLHFEVRKNGQHIDPESVISPCPRGRYGTEGYLVPLRCKI